MMQNKTETVTRQLGFTLEQVQIEPYGMDVTKQTVDVGQPEQARTAVTSDHNTGATHSEKRPRTSLRVSCRAARPECSLTPDNSQRAVPASKRTSPHD